MVTTLQLRRKLPVFDFTVTINEDRASDGPAIARRQAALLEAAPAAPPARPVYADYLPRSWLFDWAWGHLKASQAVVKLLCSLDQQLARASIKAKVRIQGQSGVDMSGIDQRPISVRQCFGGFQDPSAKRRGWTVRADFCWLGKLHDNASRCSGMPIWQCCLGSIHI